MDLGLWLLVTARAKGAHTGNSVLKFFQILLQMQIVTFNIENKLQQAMIKNGKIG